MIIKKASYNNRIKSIKIDKKAIKEMADHLIGKRLSAYREDAYDSDGDGKVTFKDFIQRIKDIAESGIDTANISKRPEPLIVDVGLPPPPP